MSKRRKWARATHQETITIRSLIEYLAEYDELPAVMHTVNDAFIVDGDPLKNYTISGLTAEPAVVEATVYQRRV